MPRYIVNDFILLLLTFIYTVAVLFAPTSEFCLLWLFLSLFQLIIAGKIKWKYLGIFTLIMIIPSIAQFITGYMHLDISSSAKISLFGFKLYQEKFNLSLYLVVRAFSLSLISFAYLTAIRYDRLIYSLIQNLKFPVKFGYALMASFNALGNLQEEFFRIRIAARLRFSRQPLFYFYIIPLLVSATRYSQQAAVSMQTRGLSEKKSFLIEQKLKSIDLAFLLINILGVILLFFIKEEL